RLYVLVKLCATLRKHGSRDGRWIGPKVVQLSRRSIEAQHINFRGRLALGLNGRDLRRVGGRCLGECWWRRDGIRRAAREAQQQTNGCPFPPRAAFDCEMSHSAPPDALSLSERPLTSAVAPVLWQACAPRPSQQSRRQQPTATARSTS